MAAVRGTPPQYKVQTVEELKKMISSRPVVAIVGFRNVPAGQMQKIRRDFRGKLLMRVVKNSLLERALDGLGGDYLKLKDYLGDQIAIIVADENPFRLFKMVEETKVPSPLKPNQVSPVDVVVEQGPTPIPPGPLMAELQMAGLPVAIEKGKVVVKTTTTVVKAGEVVKPEVARALERLDVRPIKIGLDVKAILDSGVVLTPDVLAIDTEKVLEDFQRAYQMALNLAVSSAYVTEETAEILIMKAFSDARNLALNAGIFAKGVMEDLIAKAHTEMLALASNLPEEALDDELKSVISGLAQVTEQVTPTAEEEVEEEKEEEEEEEEEKEEEAIEGLGALFG
ncbi:50S ribosomal protein L10 [Archaeoglobus neptunius]|uniref:50S ribosomal protein L10 n=1 Tax=Archaeoglobus neptunius TaxID=2798580 RepID=UPI0019278888|nr:50S ribosomal protein L10 [Archaeoglobus neptunius]